MPGGGNDGQEKTEQPTARRLQEARKKGQVARSPELSGAVALFVMLLVLHASPAGGDLLDYLRRALATPHEHLLGAGAPGGGMQEVARASRDGLRTLAATVGIVALSGMLAGMLASFAQVGFLWTTQPLVPDPAKLNPLSGLQRLVGIHGVVEALKAIFKLGIVGWIVYAGIRDRLVDLIALPTRPTEILLPALGSLLYALSLRVAVAFLLIALCDYAYQRWEHNKNLKMSKQEIKQEHKQSEGSPEVKAQIRRLQIQASRRRMMEDVPKADVVITNPTHFAIALAYDRNAMGAPVVLAKGTDLIAARIRQIAGENDVPLFPDPPLARSLYKEVEVGQEIPAALYAAVAEVLAYVYEQDKGKRFRR
jgi:flagellar biosynthetic protein FlhB